MTQIRVRTEGFDALVADMTEIAKKAPIELKGIVRDNIKAGNTIARDFATVSAGRHGKRYPKAFSAEMTQSLFDNVYQGEYGPDVNMPQGGMSFEFGSRNQKPHLDLAKSADLIGPSFDQEVGDAVDRWFW